MFKDIRAVILAPKEVYDALFDLLFTHVKEDDLKSAVLVYALAGAYYCGHNQEEAKVMISYYVKKIKEAYDDMPSDKKAYCDKIIELLDDLPLFLCVLPKQKMHDVFEYARKENELSPLLIEINPFYMLSPGSAGTHYSWATVILSETPYKLEIEVDIYDNTIFGTTEEEIKTHTNYVTIRDCADGPVFDSDEILITSFQEGKRYQSVTTFKYCGHMLMLMMLHCKLVLVHNADDTIDVSFSAASKGGMTYFTMLDVLSDGKMFTPLRLVAE